MIFFRRWVPLKPFRINLNRLRRSFLAGMLYGCTAAAAALPVPAQVLARPGWAGSGVVPEDWWVRAVIYRLDPARFQDSDGDGHGDLQGVAQRLDYLQSLGVDAILLDGQLRIEEMTALADLTREASRRQLRILLTVPKAMPQQELAKSIREWLGAGAAGLWLPKGSASPDSDTAYTLRVNAVRAAMQSFPGNRVLLTVPAPIALNLPPRPARRINPDSFHAGKGGLLVVKTLMPASATALDQARSDLSSVGDELAGPNTALRFTNPPATNAPDVFANAALLLGSRGAVVLDFGQELGLNLYAGTSVADLPLMQWTPLNQTAPPATPTQQAASSTTGEVQFGSYHPYVPPPRGITAPPSTARVVPDRNIPDALPAPDTLPGFTTGPLATKPEDGARLNVIVEDRDPKSLLNAYRQLIAIHHDNATVRNGTQYVLSASDSSMLVWVRRAPSGSRIVANVIGAVNLSDRPASASLNAGLEAQGMRPGAIRTLFSSVQDATTGESTTSLTLPAHGALLGEIYHSGIASEPAPRVRRSTRRSGRRIRR